MDSIYGFGYSLPNPDGSYPVTLGAKLPHMCTNSFFLDWGKLVYFSCLQGIIPPYRLLSPNLLCGGAMKPHLLYLYN